MKAHNIWPGQWEYRTPQLNDTIKLYWAAWTKRNPTIGVVVGEHQGKFKIDVGSKSQYFDKDGEFEVLNRFGC